MATGNEILSYLGDANSGIASSRGALNVYGVIDSTALGETAKQLALASYESNKLLYKQRIEDRNSAFQMLDDDQLVLDNVLEEHRPVLDKAKQKVQDVFFKYNGDIYSNPERFREFQAAISEAKSAIKHSQKWYTWMQTELGERSKKTNSFDQQQYDKSIRKELDRNQNNFWALPTPYAPITDYDLNKVAKVPVYGEIVQTKKGNEDIMTTTVDPAKTFDAYWKEYGTKDGPDQFDRYVNQFLSNPNAAKDIDRINGALNALNTTLKTQPGDRNYVEPINPLTDRPDQIAAKIALADSSPVITKSQFAKDRVGAGIDWYNAKTSRIRANNEGAALEWDKEKWNKQMTGSETVKNGAAIFAEAMINDIRKLADSNGVIDPSRLTNEQLKYMGIWSGTSKESSALRPITVDKNQKMEVTPEGKVLFYTTDKKGNRTYDASRSTSISNIATNRLNEENVMSGSKELNNYMALDLGVGGVTTSTYGKGGSTTITNASGGTETLSTDPADWQAQPDGKTWKYKDGRIFDASGKLVK